MTFRVETNILVLDAEKRTVFDFPIRKALKVGDIVVVILSLPPSYKMTENVFGVNIAGDILWQIPKLGETASDELNKYVDVRSFGPQQAIVSNWNGVDVTVNVATGHVEDIAFMK